MQRGRQKKDNEQNHKELLHQIALKMIENISKGYKVTGKLSALNVACKEVSKTTVTLTSIYKYMQNEAHELMEAYKQAKEQAKILKLNGKYDNVSGRVNKRDLMREIIANIKAGYGIRGKPSAVDIACAKLGANSYHWATIHRWLRTCLIDMQQEWNDALEYRKENGYADELWKRKN